MYRYVLLLTLITTQIQAADWQGWVQFEARAFAEEGVDDQEQAQGSIAGQVEVVHDWSDYRAEGILFARLDAEDDERSHFDIREAYIEGIHDRLTWRAGISRVFWGATEFRHTVDVINQIDLVENSDQEDKLGQPMISLTYQADYGDFSAYILPGFRERTFPGRDGRPRLPFVVDTDRATYESSAEEAHTDLALRFAGFFGPMDIGLSVFHGTDRDPRFIPIAPGILAPHYEQMTQFALDGTAISGSWIWKWEAFFRDTDPEAFASLTGGFEVTLVGILGDHDLGIIMEGMWDEREDEADHPFADDIFLGGRWVFNDVDNTEILGGIVTDVDNEGTFLSLEFDRRLSDNWTIRAQAQAVLAADDTDGLKALDSEDHVTLEVTWYW